MLHVIELYIFLCYSFWIIDLINNIPLKIFLQFFSFSMLYKWLIKQLGSCT